MFDLIDDLNADMWLDKGGPPDDFNEIADIADYTDYHIVSRKIAPKPINTVTYTVADSAGKNPKSIVVHGINAVDPLKNVRHFRAKLQEKDGVFVVTTILLDLDWCERK